MDLDDMRREEIDRNFTEFQKILPVILPRLAGKFVLMHRGRIVTAFDDHADALVAGIRRFPGHVFSVQEVTDKPADLGGYGL